MASARVPNAESAFIDIRKLRDYALNTEHRIGRHKAKLFSALVGMYTDDAESLHSILFQIVNTHDAELDISDIHGQRYRIDFLFNWHGKEATIRSAWIIRTNEDFPRLVTCFPLEEVMD